MSIMIAGYNDVVLDVAILEILSDRTRINTTEMEMIFYIIKKIQDVALHNSELEMLESQFGEDVEYILYKDDNNIFGNSNEFCEWSYFLDYKTLDISADLKRALPNVYACLKNLEGKNVVKRIKTCGTKVRTLHFNPHTDTWKM